MQNYSGLTQGSVVPDAGHIYSWGEELFTRQREGAFYTISSYQISFKIW